MAIMKICAETGCDREARGRGLCVTHYAYRKRHGTLPPKFRKDTSRPCVVPDCHRTVGLGGARDLCPMHYQRLTKIGSLDQPASTAPLAERFRAMISADPCACGCDCELWAGGVHAKTGYGHFSIGNKTYLAHRVSYELENGPIPGEMAIDHVYEKGCRHRHCVKNAHLEAVTDAVNNRRIPMTDRRRKQLSAAGRKGAASRWGNTQA